MSTTVQKNPFPQDQYQHYYLHDRNMQPLAVVAIGAGTEPGKIVRGIAIRSDLDPWDKVKGRKKSVGRIRKALAIKASADPVVVVRANMPGAVHEFLNLYSKDYESLWSEDAVLYPARPTVLKTGYNVTPTEREAKILVMLLKRLEDRAKAAVPTTPPAA